MWITEIGNFIANSSIKVALLVFVSSGVFLLPNSWFSSLGLLKYHNDTTQDYGVQIFIAFIVSSVILLFAGISLFREWLKNRGKKLHIIKATYGTDAESIDVTAKVKALVKKNSPNFKVDDDKLLKPGKINDPTPGSPKTLKIEYTIKYTEEYEQGKQVEIGSKEG